MPKPTERTEHELNVMANAVEWTCVRGLGAKRTVTRHASHAECLQKAIRDGRTMIYAIDANALSVHVENV